MGFPTRSRRYNYRNNHEERMKMEIKNKKAILIAAIVIGVTFIAVIITVLLELSVEDSGVSACKQMASNKNNSNMGKLTQKEYMNARKIFLDSDYKDLRESGTKFVDLVWQTSELKDMEALSFIQPLVSSYTELSGACASHGVVIPPLQTDSSKAPK